jgi:CHASE3 domain sensor protein
MNPDTQLLLAEIQKLSADQATIQKQLSDQKDLLEGLFVEADEALDKRFREVDAAVEQRIIDSELY